MCLHADSKDVKRLQASAANDRLVEIRSMHQRTRLQTQDQGRHASLDFINHFSQSYGFHAVIAWKP